MNHNVQHLLLERDKRVSRMHDDSNKSKQKSGGEEPMGTLCPFHSFSCKPQTALKTSLLI